MTGHSNSNHPNHNNTSNRHQPTTRYQDLSSIVPTITTSRLVLSLVTDKDTHDLQLAAGRPEIADTMISIPHPYPLGEAGRYIQRHQEEAQQGTSIAFVIRRQEEEGYAHMNDPKKKNNHTFIGMIEVRAVDIEHWLAELSFWVVVEAWGKGYMSEAVAAVVNFVFASPQFPYPLNRLYAFHMVRNPACGRLLQRNGFVQEGILRDRVWKHDRFEDVAICAILRRDWERQSKGAPNMSTPDVPPNDDGNDDLVC